MTDTIIQCWGNAWPEVRCTTPLQTGEGVIDPGTFNAIEIDELFDYVNDTTTTIGAAVLYRSLVRPLDSRAGIQAKQEALLELQSNPQLRADIEGVVAHAAEDEKGFYQLLYGKFLGMFGTAMEGENVKVEGYGYEPYIKGTRMMLDLVSGINDASPPESAYLKKLFGAIGKFADSRAYSFMKGPVYRTEHTLQCKLDRKKSFAPAFIFRPRIFKPVFIALVFALLWLIGQFNPLQAVDVSFEFSPVFTLFLIPLGLLYIPMIGSYDRDSCIYPLREEFKASPDVRGTFDALGQLDELLAFLKYAESFGGPMVLPQFIDAKYHRMHLEDARNPVLAKNNEQYVGNDFDLQKERLVFITGPNSGGKTAFCKTITQIQLLAQTGCFVPAKAARLTVADRIFYQVPEISHLDDGEGRFGTELKRTKNIFLACTANSLVVLDELSEGTTYEEKLETSANVLDGFYQLGCSTILITHNHQLVDNFVSRGLGLPRQVQFAKNAPTYKLIKGISRVSHADRVARKIGFSKEDIAKYLNGTRKKT